jgi:hypothetical protein
MRPTVLSWPFILAYTACHSEIAACHSGFDVVLLLNVPQLFVVFLVFK